MAKFQSWKVKEKVVKKAREIKLKSVKFVHDFSKRTMEKRSSHIQDMIAARKAGKVPYFVNVSKLVVKDRQPIIMLTEKIQPTSKRSLLMLEQPAPL